MTTKQSRSRAKCLVVTFILVVRYESSVVVGISGQGVVVVHVTVAVIPPLINVADKARSGHSGVQQLIILFLKRRARSVTVSSCCEVIEGSWHGQLATIRMGQGQI